MSLVNDALKRTHKVQQEAPPPKPNLKFQPADAAPEKLHRVTGLLLPAVLALMGVLTLFAAWRLVIERPKADAAPLAQAEPASQVPPDVQAIVEAHAREAVTPTAVAEPAPTLAPTPAPPPVVAAVEAPVATPVPVAVPPSLPRLQSVISHPTRPSAMINGQCLFVGDKFEGQIVLSIQPGSVLIGGPNGTNSLTLDVR